jgi:localization factor PodJL
VDNHKSSDAARAVLLSAARALMAENANFSVKALLTKANVTRAQFRRHFAGKAELLSALAGQDVKELSDILEAVQPVRQSLRAAVGAPALAPPAPAADQWLERRLRVFERALAALEKRQQQSEQSLTQALARLQEKLDAPAAIPVAQAAAMAEPVPAPQAEPPAPEETPEEPVCAGVAQAEESAVPEKSEPAVSEKEIQDFIAHAREAAKHAAALAEAAPPPVRKTPWLAWGGAAMALLLLLGVGLLLTGGAFGHGRPVAGSGVSHRQVAQGALPRMLALADNGDAEAQSKLALAYLRGNSGVAEDEKAALRWARAAAAQGQPVAQYLLGTLYLEPGRDQREAVRWFSQAAGQGNIKAMHNLAIAYAEGLGVAADPQTAVTWFVRAAEQGYRDSQFDLAVMYERGTGVPQDAVAALKWYRIAAAQGDAPSAARAQFLMTQLKAADVNAAMDAAAAFAPKPSVRAANEAGGSKT